MGARFIGGDRDQVFLMPPLVTDWVPEDHLVWTVLEAVGEPGWVPRRPGLVVPSFHWLREGVRTYLLA
jgi:hypothetical protein